MNQTEQLAETNLRMHGARLPNQALPACEWEDLLDTEATVEAAGEKIISMCETNNRRLAGAEQEAGKSSRQSFQQK